MNRRFTEDLQAINRYMKKMFNIFSNKRNANQNYTKISFTPIRMVITRMQETIGVGEDVGKKVHSYIAGGAANFAATLESSVEIP